jgi:hypothetical protein
MHIEASLFVKSCLHIQTFFYRREVFPDGILYASRESHYSVFKAARMYRLDCVKVDTLVSGEIDCADFGRRLFENKDKPAIINVNIGELQSLFHLQFHICMIVNSTVLSCRNNCQGSS